MSQPAAEQTLPVPPRLPMLRTLGLVAAISGFLVVLTHQLTTPLIEENKRIAIERALFKVVPGAVSRRDFLLTPGGIEPYTGTAPDGGMRLYAGYDEQGRLAGVALEAAAQGYQDVIRVLYGFDPACQCIRGVQVLKMAETPGIGDKIARDPEFLRNFEALDARPDAAGGGLANAIISVKAGSKTEAWQIDAISGATISSRAVARMLDDSAQQAVPVIMRHLEALGDAAGGTP
jgi:electron transport complex protein RnfG